jgi:hypothetical protein
MSLIQRYLDAVNTNKLWIIIENTQNGKEEIKRLETVSISLAAKQLGELEDLESNGIFIITFISDRTRNLNYPAGGPTNV